MRIKSPLAAMAAFLVLHGVAAPFSASARDWFVRPGSEPGDGSQTAPFNDPWRALERCEAGDRVHLAGGSYFGRFGTGTWEIPFERVQLLGGYDAQFAMRNPWQNPTQLCWDSTSKNWPKTARLWSDRRDVVVDGLVIDMQDQNAYLDEQKSGRTERPGENAMLFTERATVRNCIVINPGLHAINGAAGSTIENNLIINPMIWGIVVTGAGTDPASIRHNTVLFAWDPNQKVGLGGFRGAAVALRAPASVADNILAHCDNSAIYSVTDPAHVSIVGNLFWKNRFSNLTAEMGAQRAVIGDADLEMLEDVGLARQGDNTVGDPGLPFDPGWLERTTRREEAPAEPPPGSRKTRSRERRKQQEVTQGVAPACSLSMALDLVRAREVSSGAGAHVLDLPAPTFTDVVATAAQDYVSCPLTEWNRTPGRQAGRRIEMVVAVASSANISAMPAAYPQSEIAGVFLYDPDGNGERITGFFRKGTEAARVCADAIGYYQGRGKPERLHVVRGVAYEVAGVPKGAFYIEAIEPWEAASAAATTRQPGRDWFVRAAATGGDGSREKPFRDPFQALERCEAGDMIHVAGGDYFGKLKAGHWSIGMPHITLLGGYDETFASRAPWQHSTRLFCPPDFQGVRGGYTLEGADDHTGAIIDGFIFDKRHNNVYAADGEIDLGHSDKTEHLWLSRPGCVVRNCVFLNGALGAVRAANGQTFENNVFINHVTLTVWVESGHTTAPFVFRNNTALFGWTRRFGYGLGANGNLLRLGGNVRAVVENNLFAYADNDAIRLEADPRDVALRGNIFAHNLWSHVQQMNGWHAFDDRTFGQLADLGFRVCEGNQVSALDIAIDETWLRLHQATRGPETFTKSEAPPASPSPKGEQYDESPSGKAADGPTGAFAPAYDWQAALNLFRADAVVGARSASLAIEFTGIAREMETHDYTAADWATAKGTDSWDRLAGQRIALEVGIQRTDNQYFLPGVTAADYDCYLVTGPAGIDSGGLPLRCYVRKGTQAQRTMSEARDFQSGKPLELYFVKGVAKERRQMLVEAVEKSR